MVRLQENKSIYKYYKTPSQMHPLNNAWTLYAHTFTNVNTYGSGYIPLQTVETCEEWGRLMHHVCQNSLAPYTAWAVDGMLVASLSFFKKNILPEWEDTQNVNGTTLSIKITANEEDDTWLRLCAVCACGVFETRVNGVQITRKQWKQDEVLFKIDIWLHASANVETITQVLLTHFPELTFQNIPRACPAPLHSSHPPKNTSVSRKRVRNKKPTPIQTTCVVSS